MLTKGDRIMSDITKNSPFEYHCKGTDRYIARIFIETNDFQEKYWSVEKNPKDWMGNSWIRYPTAITDLSPRILNNYVSFAKILFQFTNDIKKFYSFDW